MNRRCLCVSRNRRSSLPPGGEGGAKRRMRAKQANVVHNATHRPASVSPVGGGVTRYVQTTEIPPAGAPPGGRGSLCGNVWLSRSPLHPVCRFAQDDTGGNRGVIRNLFGVKYSTVKLTDTAFCFSSHAPATLRVILSEAAPLTKNHVHPQIIAAQSNPAPRRGASRRDLHC